MIKFLIDVSEGLTNPTANIFNGLDGDPATTFRSELDQSAAAILNRLRTTYMAQQDPTGAAWVPSKASIKRRSTGGGGGTLFNTGNLFRSIQLVPADGTERVIKTDVPYGYFHQYGIGQVRREFLSITDEHKNLATSIFQAKLAKLVQ